MREPKSLEIRGMLYTVAPLPPTPALDLLTDLVRMIGPGLAPIFDNAGSLAAIMDRDVSEVKTAFLGDAFKALTTGLDKRVIKSAIDALKNVTTVSADGGKTTPSLAKVYEAHFADRGLGELFLWLKFALEVQFGDFFGAVAEMMPDRPRDDGQTTQAKE